MFIVIEGIDGSGKSTQAALLHDWYVSNDWPVEVIQDPGTTPAGLAIRQILLNKAFPLQPASQALLFNAVRHELSQQVTALLAAGKTVISDRWTLSTICYQGYGYGLPLASLRWLAREFSRTPDLTIVLDVPVDLAKQRKTSMVPAGYTDRFEAEGVGFFEKLAAGYRLEGVAASGVVLDGTGRPPEVHGSIRAVLAARHLLPGTTRRTAAAASQVG